MKHFSHWWICLCMSEMQISSKTSQSAFYLTVIETHKINHILSDTCSIASFEYRIGSKETSCPISPLILQIEAFEVQENLLSCLCGHNSSRQPFDSLSLLSFPVTLWQLPPHYLLLHHQWIPVSPLTLLSLSWQKIKQELLWLCPILCLESAAGFLSRYWIMWHLL